MTSHTIRNGLNRLRTLLRRAATSVDEIADGEEPVATSLPGAIPEWDRETSTNARTSGSTTEPWSR